MASRGLSQLELDYYDEGADSDETGGRPQKSIVSVINLSAMTPDWELTNHT